MKRRKWTEDIDAFLRANTPIPVGGSAELLAEVNAAFDSAFTLAALKGYCADAGITICGRTSAPRGASHWRHRPVGSERTSKGYIVIKTAEPDVWEPKQRVVWRENHPGEEISADDVFIFLDGDTRNFTPENIFKISRRHIGPFNSARGVSPGYPEETRVRILWAAADSLTRDLGERTGAIVRVGSTRMWRDDVNRRARRYREKKRRVGRPAQAEEEK